jgi:hypothetical protein
MPSYSERAQGTRDSNLGPNAITNIMNKYSINGERCRFGLSAARRAPSRARGRADGPSNTCLIFELLNRVRAERLSQRSCVVFTASAVTTMSLLLAKKGDALSEFEGRGLKIKQKLISPMANYLLQVSVASGEREKLNIAAVADGTEKNCSAARRWYHASRKQEVQVKLGQGRVLVHDGDA